MSKNKTDNNLDSFRVQEIKLRAEERILKIKKLQRKAILFCKKSHKCFFGILRKKRTFVL